LDPILLGLYLGAFGLLLAGVWRPASPFAQARWPDSLFLFLAVTTTLFSLSRRLPAQNVLLGLVTVLLISGAAEYLNRAAQFPFGPRTASSVMERQLVWGIPLLWVVAILNARGVARLIMRPWRQSRAYGLWVIGLSVLLAVWLDFSLEPFATHVRGYWSWGQTRLSSDWYGTPWVNFLGWVVTALIILAFVTPSLINKNPARHPPQYQPLCVWVTLNLLLLAGAATTRLWPPAALAGAQVIFVTILALFGAMRRGRQKPS